LIWIVYSFEISVLNSFFDFHTIELGFQTLKSCCQFMSFIVFVAVLCKLMFLIFNQKWILFFKSINLKVQRMNHALKLWDIWRSMVDLHTCVLRLIASLDELLIKWSSSVNKRFSFFVKNCDSCILGKTFLFPFWESTVSLINCALLSLSELLIFRDLIL